MEEERRWEEEGEESSIASAVELLACAVNEEGGKGTARAGELVLVAFDLAAKGERGEGGMGSLC